MKIIWFVPIIVMNSYSNGVERSGVGGAQKGKRIGSNGGEFVGYINF